MSKLPKKMQEGYRKTVGDHQRYISRITKTLYYGKFPKPEGLSLPITELAADLFSEAQQGRSLNRLHYDDASVVSRNICVSPCSLVLAILYLEKLKKVNPEYLERTAPSDLFLVSLMVSCKFLYDDGEVDEVFLDEWALSAGISVKHLIELEKKFLKAINWDIFINRLTFWKKLTEIETKLAEKQGLLRGFFTYTELQNLLTTVEFHTIIENIVAITAILVATYVAALLTLLGSLFIVSHVPGTWLQQKRFEYCSITSSSAMPEFMIQINEVDTNQNFTIIRNVEYKVDYFNLRNVTHHILKSDIFLASVERSLKPICNATYQRDNTVPKEQPKVNDVLWYRWTVPSLKWFSESTNLMEKLKNSKITLLHLFNFYETYKRKTRILDVDDHVFETSKDKIDNKNLEGFSWTRKWFVIEKRHLHHYMKNINSYRIS